MDVHGGEDGFRSLVEKVADYAIFMMDLEGRPSTWNEGVRRTLGFEEAEFVGHDVLGMIFTSQDVAAGIPRRELERAAQAGTASNDRWMRRKDGSTFFALGITVARRDAAGNLVGFAKILRDQTLRKHMENELRLKTAELSEAVRRQGEFLALLSHELRNPLAPIRNAVEIVRMTGGAGDKGARAIQMMTRQLEHLVRLVDDLLDVSRIANGRIVLRLERIDIGTTLRQAVDASEAQCAAAGQRLEVKLPERPLEVEADPTRIVQVVSNLLNNASKFTPAGGRVGLDVSREDSHAVIRVSDTGIGIEPEQQLRIFEMFTQVQGSIPRSQGGLGIGLGLAKRLVEMHGGTIEARSPGPSKGSEFVIRLPLAGRPLLSEAAGAPASPGVPRNRILLVDDNADAAESLATLLRLNGHDVVYVEEPARAREAVGKGDIDVALLDANLHRVDVVELARELRGSAREERPLLVIGMAAWGEKSDPTLRPDAGFDAHVSKPVEHEMLLQVIAELRGGAPSA